MMSSGISSRDQIILEWNTTMSRLMIYTIQIITLLIIQVTITVTIQSMATISTSEEPLRHTMQHLTTLMPTCTETHAFETDLYEIAESQKL